MTGLELTLLLPLYWRAMETRRPDAMVQDPIAVDLVQRIDFDFSRFAHLANSQQVFILMRTRQMDRWARSFLAEHPDGVVVDLGCGLDAVFERVDNGRVAWYDLDLPNVIALRKKFYTRRPGATLSPTQPSIWLGWTRLPAGKDNPACLYPKACWSISQKSRSSAWCWRCRSVFPAPN